MKKTNQKFESYFRSNSSYDSITIFTPTYNRAKFLERIYDNLLRQTSKQFVWILVNDGSADNTDEVATDLLSREGVPMLYISKKNGGKHSAFEAAFSECKTKYFLCMDDDDKYINNAVERFLFIWNGVEKSSLSNIGAVRTLCQRTNGNICSSPAVESDGSFYDRSTLEQNFVYNVIQENWTCYLTESLKQVDLFPKNYWMSDKHTFFSEAIWQGRFARKFKCRYVNEVFSEYTDDAPVSIIRARRSKKHYLNMFLNSKIQLDEQYDYISRNKISLFKSVCIVAILRSKLGISQKELLNHTNNTKLKFLYSVLYPFAWLSPSPKILKD